MITQSLNTDYGTPNVGDVATSLNLNRLPARINPASSATYIAAGQAVKLLAGVSPNENVVDVIAAGDAVFGTILYNMKRNVHPAGEVVEVATNGSIVFLESGAAITRGQLVVTNPADGTVSPGATNPTGVALTEVTAANQIVRVKIGATA
jgi:hypothetical protein